MLKNKTVLAIFCFLLMLIMLLSSLMPKKSINVNAEEMENFSCTAKSMVVIEAVSKRVLLEKNMNEQLPMASTTKIMTALVAIENCKNLDEQFAVDNRAVGIEGTSIYLRKDERLTMRELLYGLLLASGNDAAMAIAYRVGDGQLEKFIDMMNKKAENLGLNNTHFTNPHGLDNKEHYTSAYDLAIISAKAMESKDFREIVKTEIKQLSSPKDAGNRFVRNKHKLLNKFNGCDGIKTGYTDNARRCCVTSVIRNDFRVICVVLNCNDMFLESQKCIENCYDNYEYVQLVEPYKYIDSVNVNDGTVEKVKLFVKGGYRYPLKEEEKTTIKIETDFKDLLEAPVEKNVKVGDLKVYLNNELIFSENIYTIENVEQKGIADKVRDIIERWYYD